MLALAGGVLVALISLLLSLVVGVGANKAPAVNPPGNNGTIKVDNEPFDDNANNETHVGCTFQVDFYGYDKGDLDDDVIFTVHPPTGNRR